MATGTTADSDLTRNEIIDMAYLKLGIGNTSALTTRAIKELNLILREEDLVGTDEAKNLWAMSEASLILTADGFIYTSSDGLNSNILDLDTAYYRNTGGDDARMEIINQHQYESIVDKNDTGDPEKVHLEKNRVLSSRTMRIWPAKSSIGTTSEVTGSDTLNYQCIMLHTSAADNKPITGANYKLYWQQTGSAGSAWVTATEYTNSDLIRYTYKRPLFDFDSSTDNPDFPQGWTRYLMYRLAHDLSPEFDIDMEARRWLKSEYREARNMLFPSTRPDSTDIFNKVMYF